MIEISFPVDPHVKKYLMRQYGTETIPFRRNDPIHSFFLSLLERPSTVFKHSQYKKPSGNKVKFVISRSIKEKVGCVLPDENIIHLNFFIDHLIKSEFYSFVDSKIEEGMRTKNAIEAFCEKYEMGEEDIKFETLKKAYYRYEQKKSQKNVCVKCPVIFSPKTAA
jgi:hypothetical protein